ncbi:MAG: hypothetical protein KKB20_18655 [Proteobacteria bacterium]|nr:hypothetical protein [Pseudomonadota bacterium]
MPATIENLQVPDVDTSQWPLQIYNDYAASVVAQRFASTQQYAEDSLRDARNFLEELQEAVKGFDAPDTDIDYSFVPSSVLDALAILTGYRPSAPSSLAIAPITDPNEPDLSDVDEVSVGEIPDFGVEAYMPVYPDAPDSPMPADPGDAPSIVTPERIAPPDLTWPAPPTLEDLTIPGAVELLSQPSFAGVKPTISITPPDPMFVYNEPVSDRDLAEAVKAKLLADLAAGGTGLGEDAEAALWERAKERERLEYVAERARIVEQNAGFDLPPGAMVARLDELSSRRQRSLAQSNYEITIEQARLAQAHLHFAIEQANGLQRIINENSNAVAQRTFESARYTVESAIQVYDARVRAFNAKLDVYKAEATVYSEMIRAMTLYLEQYKARLEGVRLASDIQNQKVALYNARLEAVKTLVGVYSERVRAQATEMEGEKVKLQAFATAVEVFSKKVEARTAEFNLWQARVAGEGEKVKVYGQQVEAFGKRLEAIKTDAEIQKITIDGQVQKNRDEIEVYKARIEKHRSDVQRAIEQVKAYIQAYGVDVEAYRTDAEALKGQQGAEIELVKARMQQAKNQSDLAVQEANLRLQSAFHQYGVVIESIKALIASSTQIAASAMSAVSVQASMGLSSSLGTTCSYTRGESVGYEAKLGKTRMETITDSTPE